MKFAHQLKFNSVPEWKEYYIHYAVLKKIIYQIAKAEGPLAGRPSISFDGAGVEDGSGSFSQPLLGHSNSMPQQFRTLSMMPGSSGLAGTASMQLPAVNEDVSVERLLQLLDKELVRIDGFFSAEEAKLLGRLKELDMRISNMERMPTIQESFSGVGSMSLGRGHSVAFAVANTGDSGDSGDSGELIEQLEAGDTLSALRLDSQAPRTTRIDFWHSLGSGRSWTAGPKDRLESRKVVKARDDLRRTFTDLFVGLHDLIEYWKINYEGFRKVLKKHDKVNNANLKARYWPRVEAMYPKASSRAGLEAALEKLIDQYAVLFMKGDTAKAKAELSRQLREHIQVERSTVWRDMVAIERRAVSAKVKSTAPEGQSKWYARYISPLKLAFCVTVFLTLLWVPVFDETDFEESEEGQKAMAKNNCLALLAFASLLWSLEALPLFTTSMLVPALVVVLRVLASETDVDPDSGKPVKHWHRLTAEQAAATIFHNMFSQVIMLLLGGFAIAGALSKHAIAKQMAVTVLSKVGRRPEAVLLACMFVATFASMWISNVAAPVLCFSLVTPILRTLDADHPFSKSLVMGIALASNIGGMTSPISSPQNIFAIDEMKAGGVEPTWLSWFAVALPLAIIGNLLIWIIIRARYSLMPGPKITEVRPLKPNTDPINGTQVYVIIVSIVTVGLWCANKQLSQWTGEMGVLAVVPLVAFFGFGVLNKDDFNGFLWNVVMLAMGGSALGEAVKSSGLLSSMAVEIQHQVTKAHLGLFHINMVFCAMVLISTSFISHTVGAFVILPIVRAVGQDIVGPDGRTHQGLLIMTTALMCSGAMGLPVSGFPNMNAVALEDNTGSNYVNTGDFLTVGVPSSLVAYTLIVTVGYKLAMLLGF